VIATEASLPGVIHFAACRDDEFAWESGGQGDFTAAGTSLLAGAVSRGDNNETFLQAIHSAVVVKQRQHPLMMQPASGMEGLVLLKALAKGSEPTRTDRDGELLGHVAAMDRILRERAMG
jgi:hypothetical protein